MVFEICQFYLSLESFVLYNIMKHLVVIEFDHGPSVQGRGIS